MSGGTVTIDDGLWEELVRATGGAVNLCFQCGACSAACPWSRVRSDYNVRMILREAQCNAGDGSQLWRCTTCAQCEVTCPHGVNITKVIQVLRDRALKKRLGPREFNGLLWSVFWNGNPYKLPPSQRMAWAKGKALPAFNPDREFLLYFGDDYCYDQRGGRVARALLHLLEKGGVDYGTLGEDETGLGQVVAEVGHVPFFNDVVAGNAKKFNEMKVKEIVCLSPHDLHVLRQDYPRAGTTFRARHVLQLVKELLDSGRLTLSREVKATVAYHDPCYLGRRNGVFDEPREILRRIPGLTLVEFPSNRHDALCCGGGGGRMWLDTPAEERFSNLRMKEAAGTTATIVATGCPLCIINFEDSVKNLKMPALRVMDVLEIVSLAAGE